MQTNMVANSVKPNNVVVMITPVLAENKNMGVCALGAAFVGPGVGTRVDDALIASVCMFRYRDFLELLFRAFFLSRRTNANEERRKKGHEPRGREETGSAARHGDKKRL